MTISINTIFMNKTPICINFNNKPRNTAISNTYITAISIYTTMGSNHSTKHDPTNIDTVIDNTNPTNFINPKTNNNTTITSNSIDTITSIYSCITIIYNSTPTTIHTTIGSKNTTISNTTPASKASWA